MTLLRLRLHHTEREHVMDTLPRNSPPGFSATKNFISLEEITGAPITPREPIVTPSDLPEVTVTREPIDTGSAADGKGPRKKGPSKKFDPTAVQGRATRLLAKASRREDPLLNSDAQRVEATSAGLSVAASRYCEARLARTKARAAKVPFTRAVDVALASVVAILKKDRAVGWVAYQHCKVSDPVKTAGGLLARMLAGTLGVDPAVVDGLKQVVHRAKPSEVVHIAAVKAEAKAMWEYGLARKRLTVAMALLQASLTADRARTRRLQLAPLNVKKGAARTT
jgi:hypothetical protein